MVPDNKVIGFSVAERPLMDSLCLIFLFLADSDGCVAGVY